jgi:short-subunit dehydrogenase
MSRFDGKNFVVTGASAGIGAALAGRLAEEGATVHLAARRRAKLDDHVAAIRARGGTADAHECDIARDRHGACEPSRRSRRAVA